MELKGVITAMVTPFRDGAIDFLSIKKIIKEQLDGGIDGLVIAGTTGESPTLSRKEKETIFSYVKSEVAGHIPLIMGTGSNSTYETVEETKIAEKMGADAALVVVPYYNKPPQEGLYRHFEKVAESTRLPIILYNVPSRTIVSLTVDTISRLSDIANIVGIKEASGNIKFTEEIIEKTTGDFFVLSGDDATYLDLYGAGAEGVISVISNVIPKQTKEWAINYDSPKTKEEFNKFKPFIDSLFMEANPIPVKMCMYWRGTISTPDLRLPLVRLSDKGQEILKEAMRTAGLK